MDRKDARTALRLAESWDREGLLQPGAAAKLQARYGAAARSDGGESFGSSVLYGLGGILLGAAVLALLFLLIEQGVIADEDSEDVAPWLFLAWGALMAVVAFAIDLRLRKPELADAFHVAALFAVTAAGLPHARDLPLWGVAMVFALAIAWYRQARFMVPFLAVIAFNAAVAIFVWGKLERTSDELAVTVWFPFAVVQLVVLMALGHWARRPWTASSAGSATLLTAGTFLAFYFDVIEENLRGFSGDVEVFLAALMAAAMVAGLGWKEKGVVVAAAAVIAVDAIAFAFDVGRLIGGLIAILAVAGLLIWQAGFLRRYLRDD